jgi:hypothetical protein
MPLAEAIPEGPATTLSVKQPDQSAAISTAFGSGRIESPLPVSGTGLPSCLCVPDRGVGVAHLPSVAQSILNYPLARVLTDRSGTSICPHLNVAGGITDKNRIRPLRVRTEMRQPQYVSSIRGQ